MSAASTSRTIPIFSTKPQYLSIKGEVDAAIQGVLDASSFILGPQVSGFESEFARYLGAEHCVGAASGTDAIQLALRAVGVQPGDEVLTVSHTACATTVGIELAGGRPRFVDIQEGTFNIDPAALETHITPRTRAIVPVHLYGRPVDLGPLLEVARRHSLWVVEDAAQAHGATYRGRRVGTIGDAGAFSFYPTKNLGAYGDGGAVVTTDGGVAERLRLLREYGWTRARRYVSTHRGLNSRLDELQAAILRVKLSHLDDWNARRRSLAALYHEQLAGVPWLALPTTPPDAGHVYHLFVVRTADRDELAAHLRQAGIGSQIHYPVPIHQQDAYLDLGYAPGSLPITERIVREILSLPLYPELSIDDVRYVAATIKRFRSS